MISPNGTGASRRLRVAYETLTYTLDGVGGETVELHGYKRGDGCPISVEIEVEGAYAEYSEDRPSDDDQAAMTTERYVATAMRAARLLRRNLLCAVIPDLQQGPADVLAADGGPWESILSELGWWQEAEAPTAGEAPADDPIPSTGSPALPDSSEPSTALASRRSRR